MSDITLARQPQGVRGGAADAPGGPAGERQPKARFGQMMAVRVSLLVLALLLWWAFAATHAIPSAILPSPAAVVQAAGKSGHTVLQEIGGTLLEAAMALGISWLGGLLLGVLLGGMKPLRPLLGLGRAAYAVPIVIIYPIMTVWFGYGALSKVVFGALAGLVPMMLMSASAVMTVDPKINRLFQSMGSSRAELLRKGILPASVPGVVGALRLSGSLAFVSVIVGEMLVSTHGLGYFIANSAQTFDTPAVYLGICCVIGLAIVLHSLLGLIEKASSGYGAHP